MFVLSAADLRAVLPMAEAIAAMKRAFAAPPSPMVVPKCRCGRDYACPVMVVSASSCPRSWLIRRMRR